MTVHGVDTVVSPQLRDKVNQLYPGKLCVRRNGLPHKTRRFVATTGFGPEHNLGVYNASVNTAERALIERSFLCKEGGSFRPAIPVRQCAFTSSALCDYRDAVMASMPHLPRMTLDQVVETYTGPKKRRYEAALESLQMKEYMDRDAMLQMFVKREKQDVLKAPRVINPRSARYNLMLGQYLKHAEHHFFDAINFAWGARTRATVIKGYNVVESATILRSKWDLFKDPIAVGLDATKFDMHVSIRALKYEHSFYQRLFPGDKMLQRLLREQLVNRGVGWFDDGSVKFELQGTRCSGDLNTSLGNCILMTAMVHAYCAEKNLVAELANNGDDCVVFMERADQDAFMSGLNNWFKGKGFAMTVETPVRDFEMLEFCQTKPVWDGYVWRMVRNHNAVLRKDPMCLISVPTEKVYRRWLDAVGKCGLAITSGLPVQHAFYESFVRGAEGAVCGDKFLKFIMKNTSRLEQSRGVVMGATNVTADARASYYFAFGILPDQQLALEHHYQNLILNCGTLFQEIESSELCDVLAGASIPQHDEE